jgi:hypothetical protein
MNEEDVRALVREAIERHLGRPEPGARGEPQGVRGKGQGVSVTGPRDGYTLPLTPCPSNPSHVLLAVLPGSGVDDGMCVIEPAVRCTHCGFCQSYGH